MISNFPRNLFVISILLILIGSSCKKDNVLPEVKNQEPISVSYDELRPSLVIFRPNARFVDDLTNDLLISISPDRLDFESSNQFLDNIKIGDILICTEESNIAPDGYLVKVLMIENSSGKSFVVEQATLPDYIFYGDINIPLFSDAEESYSERRPEPSPGSGFCLPSFNECVGLSLNKKLFDFKNISDEVKGSEGESNCSIATVKGSAELCFTMNKACVNGGVNIYISPTIDDFGECAADIFNFISENSDLSPTSLTSIYTEAGGCAVEVIDWLVPWEIDDRDCVAACITDLLSTEAINDIQSTVQSFSITGGVDFDFELGLELEGKFEADAIPIVGIPTSFIPKAFTDFLKIELEAKVTLGFGVAGSGQFALPFKASADITLYPFDIAKSTVEKHFDSGSLDFEWEIAGKLKANIRTSIEIFGQGGCLAAGIEATTEITKDTEVDDGFPCTSFEAFYGGKLDIMEKLGIKLKLDDNRRVTLWQFGACDESSINPVNPPDSCLIADYWLDGNATDNSSNDNHGLVDGWATPTLDRAWNPGGALHFNGIDGIIELNGNEPIITTKEFSITAWAKMNGEGGGPNKQNPIFVQRDNSAIIGEVTSAIGLFAEQTKGETSFTLRSSSGYTRDIVFLSPSYNEWHFYAAVKTADEMILYIDGKEVNRESFIGSGVFDESIDYVHLGSHTYEDKLRGALNGDLDDVQIFDCALSADDIKSLYETFKDGPN